MKIKPLSPIFASKLTSKLRNKISKDFRYKIIENKVMEDIDSIIVLGNGNVDDLAIPILCYHLNGSKIVGITKPDNRKRISVVKGFPEYISGTSIVKLALVMDKEDQELDEIFEQIEYELRNQHIQFSIKEDTSGGQFKHYQCRFVNKTFDFILIISCLLDVQTITHKIEDHLIKAAIKLSKIHNPNLQDTKETWNSLDSRIQSEILNRLLTNKSLSSEVFPQHFKGLQLLEE